MKSTSDMEEFLELFSRDASFENVKFGQGKEEIIGVEFGSYEELDKCFEDYEK